MKIFITGIAGFIGMHAALALAERGHKVIGLDNFNGYYDPSLKRERQRILHEKNVAVINADLVNINSHIGVVKPEIILHLAAYANPRHAIKHPMLYVDTNIGGTQKVIEAAEKHNISKVIYASSSCVMYGNPIPWSEKDTFRHHESPYGWTKFVNECQFLSSLVTSVGLRFFTVYGPYGRPDMALWSFADKIVAGEPIDLYNHGNMKRDFTYIDDIVTGVIIAIETQFEKKHEILNIGNGESVELVRFVDAIEKNLKRVAIRNLVDVVPGEALESLADISKIRKLGYEPTTSVEEGVAKFIAWYKQYRHIN